MHYAALSYSSNERLAQWIAIIGFDDFEELINSSERPLLISAEQFAIFCLETLASFSMEKPFGDGRRGQEISICNFYLYQRKHWFGQKASP